MVEYGEEIPLCVQSTSPTPRFLADSLYLVQGKQKH